MKDVLLVEITQRVCDLLGHSEDDVIRERAQSCAYAKVFFILHLLFGFLLLIFSLILAFLNVLFTSMKDFEERELRDKFLDYVRVIFYRID